MMNFPITRMDILFWKNMMEDLGGIPSTIISNTKLAQFNKVYDEVSLFHYFANEVEVIEMINSKYKKAVETGQLTPLEQNMPLVLLHPDNSGKTAIEQALKN